MWWSTIQWKQMLSFMKNCKQKKLDWNKSTKKFSEKGKIIKEPFTK